MSRPIRLLDRRVIDRIAAGEVVERPASVVKELMENSLDAGALRIAVRLEDGGRRLIEVVDDGDGMPASDAAMAFVQHATSKISEVDDLDRIASLGFRGEALASVAAVSRVELLTSTGVGSGTRVVVDGGGQPHVTVAASPRGTRLLVRDLFFNTPARAKHLKSASAELTQIARVVEEFALLRTDVHFSLEQDGRTRLQAPPVSDLRERVHQIMGPEAADHWLALDLGKHPSPANRGEALRVTGGVADPECTRPNRLWLRLFVNGRVVKDARLAHAVVAAYGHTLDRGRFPVAVLHIDLPPTDLDVNVHPRKAEVRFVDPRRAYSAVHNAVAGALVDQLPPPRLRGHWGDQEQERDGSASPASQRTEIDGRLPLTSTLRERPVDLHRLGGDFAGGGMFAEDLAALKSLPETMEPPPADDAGSERGARWDTVATSGTGAAPADTRGAISGTRGPIRAIAQYRNTYILAADEIGLLVIDQHVAHERILFERVRRQMEEAAILVQRLLVSETVELSISEAETAAEHLEVLHRSGIEIEPFGGATWKIRGVPEVLGSAPAAPLVRALLGSLETGTTGTSGDSGAGDALAEYRHNIAATVACHSAVQANQPLGRDAIDYLIEKLAECEEPTRCPHGRPVLLRLEAKEIARRLKRH